MADKCTCGELLPHNWEEKEYLTCIPPEHQLRFGPYTLNAAYKKALYEYAHEYNTEEVVGTYLGHNPNFKGQKDWLADREQPASEETLGIEGTFDSTHM